MLHYKLVWECFGPITNFKNRKNFEALLYLYLGSLKNVSTKKCKFCEFLVAKQKYICMSKDDIKKS